MVGLVKNLEFSVVQRFIFGLLDGLHMNLVAFCSFKHFHYINLALFFALKNPSSWENEAVPTSHSNYIYIGSVKTKIRALRDINFHLNKLHRRSHCFVINNKEKIRSKSVNYAFFNSRTRHKVHIEKALGHLEDFLQEIEEVNGNDDLEKKDCSKDTPKKNTSPDFLDYSIVSQHLRLAIRELGHLTGQVCADQILDVIFADFCIGK